MNPISLTVPTTATVLNGSARKSDNPEDIAKAAKDFEALLISQLLRSSRGDGSGWMGSGDDQSASSLLEMSEEYLGQSLAASGGLGLAKLVTQGLSASKKPKVAE